MREEHSKIILTGKLEDEGRYPETKYVVDGDDLNSALYDFRNKKIKITIETVED